ncbi:response regulator [Geodermatophilus sp. CPCC 205506]|uniref:response regulator n=1 Tax=Geodermatophilus sp. CPCC 205506 TaxID=2936596 RepID=UPI003EF03840
MRRLLDTVDGVEVVGEAADTEAAVAAVVELTPDVVVMDLDMPGGGGVRATERIVRECPVARVLVLTMHADSRRVGEALRAGARGYVVKDAPPDDILRAIEAVHADQAILDPAVAGALLSGGPAQRSPFPQLTEREHDVLERIAAGVSNDAIAERLGISVKTVQNHVSNVLLKLGVSTRAGAVARARDAGVGS